MSELKDFLYRLNHELKPRRPDIIEKDYHLHRLLHAISHDRYLSRNMVFKGGTCLVKAHTDYYRFSEDLDFTWGDLSIWDGRTPSQIRKRCSREIDTIIEHLVEIADDLGLMFDGDKSDRGQVIIGGGGRMPRFYLSYTSVITNAIAKAKVDVNFVDRTLYPYQTKYLKSYLKDYRNKELALLFREEYDSYTSSITMECYAPMEIYTDKCRAAMTRIAYKLRDIIDIYMLEEQYGYTIQEYKAPILEKTMFMLDLYTKYRKNMETTRLPDAGDITQEEINLLIIEMPEKLEKNIQRIHDQINMIKGEII